MTNSMHSPESLRVLIVDDEPLARQRLHDLLEPHPGASVVAEAENHDAAVEALRTHSVDLVFLDVQMPGPSGIDVIGTIGPEQMPVTVFVTAYDQYALEAFELAAVDYLLKPFDDERFEQALARARQHVESRKIDGMTQDLVRLLQQVSQSEKARDDDGTHYLERIAVQTRGRVDIVPIENICYIKADGVYAELHTSESTHLIREQLSTLEERLDPAEFFRIHRSAIVRLDEVAVIYRGGGGNYAVRLQDGKKLRVSRSRVDELERRLQLGAVGP